DAAVAVVVMQVARQGSCRRALKPEARRGVLLLEPILDAGNTAAAVAVVIHAGTARPTVGAEAEADNRRGDLAAVDIGDLLSLQDRGDEACQVVFAQHVGGEARSVRGLATLERARGEGGNVDGGRGGRSEEGRGGKEAWWQ